VQAQVFAVHVTACAIIHNARQQITQQGADLRVYPSISYCIQPHRTGIIRLLLQS